MKHFEITVYLPKTKECFYYHTKATDILSAYGKVEKEVKKDHPNMQFFFTEYSENPLEKPQTKQEFSFDAIKEFDKHIDRSIVGYKNLNDLIIPIASYFVTPDSNTYDIGCSTGRMLKELSYRHKESNASFVGYDISENLLPEKEVGSTQFFNRDVTDTSLVFFNTNLVLSIFTLQFIEQSKRADLVKKIYDSLNPGGAFIVAEKIYLKQGKMQEIFTFSYYDTKRLFFKDGDILDKQVTLRRIMKINSEEENLNMFHQAGFRNVELFWASLGFRAWLLIK